jgi:hypothetical protein
VRFQRLTVELLWFERVIDGAACTNQDSCQGGLREEAVISTGVLELWLAGKGFSTMRCEDHEVRCRKNKAEIASRGALGKRFCLLILQGMWEMILFIVAYFL